MTTTSSSGPAAGTSASPSAVRALLKPEDYERVRSYLQHTIPGGTPESGKFAAVDDQMVDSFVRMLWQDYKPAYAQLGVPAPPADIEKEGSQAKGLRYYVVDSRHHRHGMSDFVGTVPMVRLTLPVDEESYTISTAIGDVLASDHLLRNQRDVIAKAYPCERVEIITPARKQGVRFAAISVYLAYEKFSDTLPKYYILEAGLAHGGPRMSYIASSMAPIVRRSDYLPTQFASPDNYYRGTLAMDSNEPQTLTIESMTADPRKVVDIQPYITISATFHRTTVFDSRLAVAPTQLYREAVVRIAAIANALNQRVADMSVLQGVFAADGLTLDWLTKPVPPSKSV